jgi:hypothetical protein
LKGWPGQFLRKDGSVFTGEVTARQLPDGRLQAILRHISERKLAEKAITTIIRRVRGESSEIFFSSMAYYLAECLSADHDSYRPSRERIVRP